MSDPQRVLLQVRRWWVQLLFLLSVAFTLYDTVRTVSAHEARIARSERLIIAIFINSSLACEASGARGCIDYSSAERGEVPSIPQLQLGK